MQHLISSDSKIVSYVSNSMDVTNLDQLKTAVSQQLSRCFFKPRHLIL